jgi:DNA invertase Pin-like site-specific DNA recombinase
MNANANHRGYRVARYLRISRLDQRPELQADETAETIARRGWTLTDSYLDKGISGSRERRPELDRLLADARRGRFDILVVWRSDRLFRSLKHMVNVLDELAALGIAFVSATEVFDTTTPQGRLLLHLVAAFAEFERGVLIERTKSGIEAARRRGAKLGRPRVVVDVVRAKHLLSTGKSLRQTAKVLGCGAATVHRALTAASVSDPIMQASAGAESPAFQGAA